MSSRVGCALYDALRARAAALNLKTAGEFSARRWASATFEGSRVRIGLCLSGSLAAKADFLSDLPELEFSLPGHFLADLSVQASGDRFEIEALTIADV